MCSDTRTTTVTSPVTGPVVLDAKEQIKANYEAYATLVNHAYEALGPKLGREWLDNPHPEFDNMAPLDYGNTHGFDDPKLEAFLIRFEHGIYYDADATAQ